jgi:hypoxanthine phosphoribosyltransferase
MKPTDGSLHKTDRAIAQRVRDIASKILKDYADKDPVLIGILNGAFMFMADLVRALSHPTGQSKRYRTPLYPEIDFIKVNSYDHTQSTGTVNLVSDLTTAIEGRHVIIVEDIVDTGLTLKYVKNYLASYKPASIGVAALLVKKNHDVDYSGFAVGDKFVFGYGLDVNGKMRSIHELRALL